MIGEDGAVVVSPVATERRLEEKGSILQIGMKVDIVLLATEWKTLPYLKQLFAMTTIRGIKAGKKLAEVSRIIL